MSGRKAKLTIEFDIVSDQFPGVMHTFDDHIASIARDVSRNPHYFKGMKVISLEPEDQTRLEVLHEMDAGQEKAYKCWEED